MVSPTFGVIVTIGLVASVPVKYLILPCIDSCLRKAKSGSDVFILNLFIGANSEIILLAGDSNSIDKKNHLVDILTVFDLGIVGFGEAFCFTYPQVQGAIFPIMCLHWHFIICVISPYLSQSRLLSLLGW